MTFPYLLRLACLSSACFFLAHMVLALAVSGIAPAAIEYAERIQPRRGARLLLALRLLPAGLSILAVVGLCIPSFLWFEPSGTEEDVGAVCLAAAALGLLTWGVSTTRGLRAVKKSRHWMAEWQRAGHRTHFGQDPLPVWLLDTPAPVLAMGGLIRPRLLVSQGMLSALSTEELDAALRHENAHRVSHDNLKRLATLFAPGTAFLSGFDKLERSWARLTEWAADDFAVAGDLRRSLSLAAALVCVARMTPSRPVVPLATSLLGGGTDLTARVERLLAGAAGIESPAKSAVLPLGLGIAAGIWAAFLTGPGALQTVHRLLEGLLR